MKLYSEGDYIRENGSQTPLAAWRGEFSRDYGRILHSASFRRLQGKTQVFPGHESDFFRNRLTHSLEVAQIAEGIADRLNHIDENLAQLPETARVNTKLCAAASLMHDLGHPPFGHNGERALDQAMRGHGGFEGNAQTLRIVARLEKKIRSESGNYYGLGLCARSLASILKYDIAIPRSRRKGERVCKGYYERETDLVAKIKANILGVDRWEGDSFKTIECSIMDLADDIAYSTYDLEDSFKANFLTPADILSSDKALLERVAKKVSRELGCEFDSKKVLAIFVDIFVQNEDPFIAGAGGESNVEKLLNFIERHQAYSNMASSSYFRTKLSSQLVNEAIRAVKLNYNPEFPMLSTVQLSQEISERVAVLKNFVYEATIFSSRVALPEYRGFEVVSKIFDALSKERGYLLMPEDVRLLHQTAARNLDLQMRVVCDFVAGMTDRYAMEFYARLHSETAQSMFKPI